MVTLWNIQKLAERLKNNTISDREKVDYIILSTAMISFFFFLVSIDPSSPEPLTSTQSTLKFISFLFEVAFAVICYSKIAKLNEQGDNKDLIERIICLGLPATIRTLVIFWLPTTILSTFLFQRFSHMPILDSIVELLIDIGFLYFYYMTLKYWIAYTSRETNTSETP